MSIRIKQFTAEKIRNKKHREEMLSLYIPTACTLQSLYNIEKVSPKEIANDVDYTKKEGAELLECLSWLQRRGWTKHAIERLYLNGDELVEYFTDCFMYRKKIAAVLSYKDHMASFHYETVYGIYDDKHFCTLYTLKKY